MFVLSYLAAMCAILLLWFVYPKDFDFGEAAGDSLLFYNAQRAGPLPPNNGVPFRSSALLYEAAPAQGFANITGGWLNGGEGGELRPLLGVSGCEFHAVDTIVGGGVNVSCVWARGWVQDFWLVMRECWWCSAGQ